MKDNLGNRMKTNYENITRMFLPRRTYTIIRLDGKAFHTLTKDLNKPWDKDFTWIMDEIMKDLCQNIQGAVLGFTQSDEISILLQDFEQLETEAWFGGNIQKIASVSSSMATFYFIDKIMDMDIQSKRKFLENDRNTKNILFDSRVFTIPSRTEVMNYFVCRQKDAIRNSISMLGQSLFSQKQLHKKSQEDIKLMCIEKGQKWENIDAGLKNGRIFYIKNKRSADSFDLTVYKSWVFDNSPIEFAKSNYFENKIPILE